MSKKKHYKSAKVGARKSRTRVEQQEAKHRLKVRRNRPMSRSDDLNELNTEIAALEGRIQGVATTYQEYAIQVSEAIKEILVTAGLWDEIHGMEAERILVQQKAQQKSNGLQAELADKIKIRDYLVSRGAASKAKPASNVETPAEEASLPDDVDVRDAIAEVASEKPSVTADPTSKMELIKGGVELVKEVMKSDNPAKKAKPVVPSF